MADRGPRAAVVRAGAAARAAGRAPRARRSRRRGDLHLTAPHLALGLHALAAITRADARSENAAHTDPARPRIASAGCADRYRPRPDRADAGEGAAMDAPRKGAGRPRAS